MMARAQYKNLDNSFMFSSRHHVRSFVMMHLDSKALSFLIYMNNATRIGSLYNYNKSIEKSYKRP